MVLSLMGWLVGVASASVWLDLPRCSLSFTFSTSPDMMLARLLSWWLGASVASLASLDCLRQLL